MSEPISTRIEGLNKNQRIIADLLWSCDTDDERSAVINKLPNHQVTDAKIVMDMILADCIDTITKEDKEFPEVHQYLMSL